MSVCEFLFLDEEKLDVFLPKLFEILHSNMSLIAPTGNSYNEDFEIWKSNIIPTMQKGDHKVVLMYVSGSLAGYFNYFINLDTNTLMMADIQIKKQFQGTGLFSRMYKWLIKKLPRNLLYVEAYANKNNYKSQSVLKHLGLVESGENKNGISYYYKGEFSNLLSRYT